MKSSRNSTNSKTMLNETEKRNVKAKEAALAEKSKAKQAAKVKKRLVTCARDEQIWSS